MEERIVSAAMKMPNNVIVMCIRHSDTHFQIIVDVFSNGDEITARHLSWNSEQGFITNKNRFVSRKEAWVIAENAGQIIRNKDQNVGTLFSEHLY